MVTRQKTGLRSVPENAVRVHEWVRIMTGLCFIHALFKGRGGGGGDVMVVEGGRVEMPCDIEVKIITWKRKLSRWM